MAVAQIEGKGGERITSPYNFLHTNPSSISLSPAKAAALASPASRAGLLAIRVSPSALSSPRGA
jgi:hypothetical protein